MTKLLFSKYLEQPYYGSIQTINHKTWQDVNVALYK